MSYFRRMLLVVAITLCGCALPVKAEVTSDESKLLQKTIGCTGGEPDKICFIVDNYGADEKKGVENLTFWKAKDLVEREGIIIAVKHKCYSACVLLIDWIPASACVYESALLGFHQTFYPKKGLHGEFSPNPYRNPRLRTWIASKGGERASRAEKDLRVLTGIEAIQLLVWRDCDVVLNKGKVASK